jgi:hypothetical protein
MRVSTSRDPGSGGDGPAAVYELLQSCAAPRTSGQSVPHSAAAGVSGLNIPDLPPMRARNWSPQPSHGVDHACTWLRRRPPTAGTRGGLRTRGFLYMVALTGVTGSRNSLDAGLEDFVARARRATDLPLCVASAYPCRRRRRGSRVWLTALICRGSRLLQSGG